MISQVYEAGIFNLAEFFAKDPALNFDPTNQVVHENKNACSHGTYSGQANDQGKANGYGRWVKDQYRVSEGLFENGDYKQGRELVDQKWQ